MTDFFDETFKILKIPVSEGIQSLINKTQCNNIETEFIEEGKKLEKSMSNIYLSEKDMLMQNLFSIELLSGVEEGSIPMDVTVYLLKSQLIDACLANHNLQRLLHV